MRLLYIANLKMPTHKAYGIQIAKNCEAFARYGAEVELVVPFRPIRNIDISKYRDLFDFYGIEQIFGFKVIPAPNPTAPGFLEKYAVIIKDFLSAWRLARYAKKQKSDYIFSRDPYTLFILSFLMPDLKNAFLEIHRFSRFRSLFYKRIINKGGLIIATTENLKKALLGLGISEKSVITIPNGVDMKMFDLEVAKNDARAKLGLPPDKKIVLYSGNLYAWKGVSNLIEAAKLLSSDVLVLILGASRPPEISSYRNIEFLGSRPYKEVPLYLKAADVLVLPNSALGQSVLYTSPLKMFEYMASQRPIVASRLPSITEVLNDKNSILVKPDNTESLFQGIQKDLMGGPDIENKVKQAYEDVKTYSLDARAKKILSLKGNG